MSTESPNPCFCPVPKSASATEAYGRSWFRCEDCALVYCTREDLPSSEQERERYTRHQNSIEDTRYVAYLNVLLEPLLSYVPKNSKGLDFGSGSEAVSAELLRRQGLEMQAWDPFFRDNDSALCASYDLICATEVVEHFHQPLESFAAIDALLAVDGVFGLLTQCWPGSERGFKDWSYARDKTHVCFYTLETMSVIAKHFSWEILECRSDSGGTKHSRSEPTAVIFRKVA